LRKISPNGVRDDFRSQLTAITAFYDAGLAAFGGDEHRSTLTEQSLLAVAVAWEGFVSDMFIAFINRDPTRFKQHLRDSFTEHLHTADKPKRVFEAYGSLDFPVHLKKADVQALADNVGSNITFPSFDKLEDKAGTWLIAAHEAKFAGLTPQQKAVVNAVIALRNHVAHRSQRSHDAMNEVLAVGALHPTGIRRAGNKFHNVGAWLKATPVGQAQARFRTILGILDAIAATF